MGRFHWVSRASICDIPGIMAPPAIVEAARKADRQTTALTDPECCVGGQLVAKDAYRFARREGEPRLCPSRGGERRGPPRPRSTNIRQEPQTCRWLALGRLSR